MSTTLIPILGDQLSFDLSSLCGADTAACTLLMVEVAEEAIYVRHHRRKLAYILSAMRHHASALRAAGWTVDYVRLDEPDNSGSFTGEIARAVARHSPERIIVTEAGEWRVQAMLEAWETLFAIPVEIRSDTRFIARMSDYCAGCIFDPTKRMGEDACPFNALYWDFLARNRDELGSNPRLRNQYRTWDRFGDMTKAETRGQAARFLERLDAEPIA